MIRGRPPHDFPESESRRVIFTLGGLGSPGLKLPILTKVIIPALESAELAWDWIDEESGLIEITTTKAQVDGLARRPR